MNTMKQMQMDVFNRCYKKDGWPKPVFSFAPGVVRLAKNQKEMERMQNEEVRMLKISVMGAIVFSAAIIALFESYT